MKAFPGFELLDKPFGGHVSVYIGNQPLFERAMPKWMIDYDSLAKKCGHITKRRTTHDQCIGCGHPIQSFDGIEIHIQV